MAVCRFWQQGNCKFGDNCKFEHPGATRNPFQSNNRFAPLQGGQSAGNSRGASQEPNLPYYITRDAIEKDLTSERPQWILSAYGPGRDAPEQLFGGYPCEQSFEEIRLHYLKGKAAGNEQQALNDIRTLYQNAQQQIQNAASNIDGAVKFVLDGANKHPNRIDICKEASAGGSTSGAFGAGVNRTASPFGAASKPNPFGGGGSSNTTTSSAFGQPSALGSRPNPFGTPAFGQPSQPASAFGQPSQTASAFGQPSQPASAFGQPSQPSQPTSAFGQPSQPTSAFGQPSQLGGGSSAFGQPSTLGQRPNPFGTPAFGQPSQAGAGGSAFGQPSQPGAGASAFGQPGALGQKPNPFAAAAANAAKNPFAAAQGQGAGGASSNPFGAPAQPSQPTSSSPFGQPAAQPPANPFGQPSQPQQSAPNPFAQRAPATNGPAANSMDTSTSNTNAFGQPTKPNPFQQAQPSGFSQPSTGFSASGASPFAAATTQAPAAAPGATGQGPYAPGSSKQHPAVTSYSTRAGGRLATWKGKRVTYHGETPGIQNFDGSWIKIWFPDGPPNYYRDTELPEGAYDQKAVAAWQLFLQSGNFQGTMPELPPRREFCVWDF